jgi:hypothetical protein
MGSVRVFVAAAPRARRYALPALVEGLEVELDDADTEVHFEALRVGPRPPAALTARRRRPAQTYRGLEYWEADRDDGGEG